MYAEVQKLFARESVTILGLMSGTSADGLDISRVRFTGWDRYPQYEVLSKYTFPYPEAFSLAFRHPLQMTGPEIAHWHMAWGRWTADILQGIGEEYDVVASHGQTLLHQPPDYTLQIGEARCIALTCNKPVICDFRTADVCLGGQGAPLIPIVDEFLLRREKETLVALNMGGIANLTYLPSRQSNSAILAWDTGPANTLIDKTVTDFTKGKENYDNEGRYARSGKVDKQLLSRLLKHPYYERHIPKSAGQEQFGSAYYQALKEDVNPQSIDDWYDLICTLTELTACTIAGDIKNRLPANPPIDKLYASGGGAENLFLMERLQQLLPGTELTKFELPGIDSASKEAFGFAYLGYCFLRDLPGNIPSVTGASKETVLGRIVW
ncbi:MAG: anhydro-N-acetylmuramic acid kinase [FCB group bacterium]|nr:anhydro-N-acetylmuramic acid kinase [FCB group bacterium]